MFVWQYFIGDLGKQRYLKVSLQQKRTLLLVDLWYEYPYRLPRFILDFFYKIDTKHLGTSINVSYLAKFSLFPSLSDKIKHFSHSSILFRLININLIKTTEQFLGLRLKTTEQFSCLYLEILLSWNLHNQEKQFTGCPQYLNWVVKQIYSSLLKYLC